MELWMPGVNHVPRGGGAPTSGPNNVIVLHTTETDGPASYSGTEPHFEVGLPSQGTRQFIPLDSSSMALYNAPGGVETNRRAGHIIQIEIVWRAANTPNMSDTLLEELAKCVRFIRSQIDVPLVSPPQGWWMPGTIAVVDSALRFSWADWLVYAGFCAHANVPENDHWDVGDFPWDRFIQILNAGDTVTPEQLKSILDAIANQQLWVSDLAKRLSVIDGRVADLHARMSERKNGLLDPGEAATSGPGADSAALVAAIRSAGLKLS